MSNRLSSLLVEDGRVPSQRITDALERQALNGGCLDTSLLEIKAIDEDVLIPYLKRSAQLPAFPRGLHQTESPQAAVLEVFSQGVATNYRAVPARLLAGGVLQVLVTVDVNVAELEALAQLVRQRIEPWVVFEYRFHEAFQLVFGGDLPSRFARLLKRSNQAKAWPSPLFVDPIPRFGSLDSLRLCPAPPVEQREAPKASPDVPVQTVHPMVDPKQTGDSVAKTTSEAASDNLHAVLPIVETKPTIVEIKSIVIETKQSIVEDKQVVVETKQPIVEDKLVNKDLVDLMDDHVAESVPPRDARDTVRIAALADVPLGGEPSMNMDDWLSADAWLSAAESRRTPSDRVVVRPVSEAAHGKQSPAAIVDPANTEPKPATETKVHATAAQDKEPGITAKPAGTQAKPVESAAKPVETAAKQVETAVKPIENSSKQVKDAVKPVEIAAKLVETAIKPVETAAKPVESKAKPVEIQAKPAVVPPKEVVAARPTIPVAANGGGRKKTRRGKEVVLSANAPSLAAKAPIRPQGPPKETPAPVAAPIERTLPMPAAKPVATPTERTLPMAAASPTPPTPVQPVSASADRTLPLPAAKPAKAVANTPQPLTTMPQFAVKPAVAAVPPSGDAGSAVPEAVPEAILTGRLGEVLTTGASHLVDPAIVPAPSAHTPLPLGGAPPRIAFALVSKTHQPLSLEAFAEICAAAQNRDEIFQQLLRGVRSRAAFALLWTPQNGAWCPTASLHWQFGQPDMLEKHTIAFADAGPLQAALSAKEPRGASFAKNDRASAVLVALDRPLDAPVWLFPIQVAAKTVAVLYVDDDGETLAQPVLSEIAQAVARAAEALAGPGVAIPQNTTAQTEKQFLPPVQANAPVAVEDTPTKPMRHKPSGQEPSPQPVAKPGPNPEQTTPNELHLSRLVQAAVRGEQTAVAQLLAKKEVGAQAVLGTLSAKPDKNDPVLPLLLQFGEDAVSPLFQKIGHAETPMDVRVVLTGWLAQWSAVVVMAQMQGLLFARDAALRAAAQTALRAFPKNPTTEKLRKELVGKLQHNDTQQRLCAIEALVALRDTSIIPDLIDVLGDEFSGLGDAVERGLQQLCVQDFGQTARRWQTWWEKNSQKPRLAWLLSGLFHANETVRAAAQQELLTMSGDVAGYHFDHPRRERERAAARWTAWWQRRGYPIE